MVGKNQREQEERSRVFTDILNSNVNISQLSSILDYGGDYGQHIPEFFSLIDKYVYDVSGVQPLPGINFIDAIALNTTQFDFVMCCHVLEHVCDPLELVEEMKKLLTPKGYLYVELPYDTPFEKKSVSNLQFLFNKYFSIRTLIRQFIKNKKGKYSHPMHEHINYFTPMSIKYALEAHGLTVVHESVNIIDCEWCKSQTINILAQLQ